MTVPTLLERTRASGYLDKSPEKRKADQRRILEALSKVDMGDKEAAKESLAILRGRVRNG